MLIPYVKLANHLSSDTISPYYLIIGNEPFLGQEAAHKITQFAKKNGFDERKIYYITHKFNYQIIHNELCTNSLFSHKKIIEIRFDPEKLSKKEGEKLIKAIDKKNEHIIIIQASTLDYKTQKESWLRSLANSHTIVSVEKIYPNQLANWLRQQAQTYDVNLDNDAINTIIDLSKGNLLWSDQILQQLRLIYPSIQVNSEQIKEILEDSSIYQLSDLTQAILRKNNTIYRILLKLQVENISPVLITAIFKKEIEVLLLLNIGNNSQNTMKQFRIWQSQQQSYLKASQIYPVTRLKESFAKIAQIDKINKGLLKGCAWTAINQLAYELIYA